MVNLDISNATYSDMKGTVTNYSVDSKTTEGVSEQKENEYTNPNFTKWYGYYDKIPEVKQPINNYATWILGRGYVAESSRTQAILDRISGMGNESFLEVMWNALVVKKFNGDSYTHVIYGDDDIDPINMKALDPSVMKHIVGDDGIIEKYEQTSKTGKPPKDFKPHEILHLSNDRVADELGGTSVIKSAEWIILARNEAMADWKRISHRSTIRVMYIAYNDATTLATTKKNYAEAMEKGELLLLPVDPKDAQFEDLVLPPVEAFLAWIRYLENAFYKAIGFPKSLTGDAEGIPESGGKMAYVNHQPIYEREVLELETNLFNQLGIKIKFNRQDNMMTDINTQENKNHAQTGFQPNDVEVKA